MNTFSHYLIKKPLSLICYIIWYIYKQPDTTQFAYFTDPFSFLFRFENKYILSGTRSWELRENIRWFRTNIVLFFEDYSLWDHIQDYFTNYRSVELNKPTNSCSKYYTFNLTRERFTPFENSINSIVEIPSLGYPLPKRYRHLKGGVNFAYLKNGKIISFASSPHLMNSNEFSFSILRGIETIFPERRQGYGIITISELCKKLFIDYNLANICLWVDSQNKTAINIYKKLGFFKEAEITAIYCDVKNNHLIN